MMPIVPVNNPHWAFKLSDLFADCGRIQIKIKNRYERYTF